MGKREACGPRVHPRGRKCEDSGSVLAAVGQGLASLPVRHPQTRWEGQTRPCPALSGGTSLQGGAVGQGWIVLGSPGAGAGAGMLRAVVGMPCISLPASGAVSNTDRIIRDPVNT